MGIPVPVCVNCGDWPCMDFPLDVDTAPEHLALEQAGPGEYYDGYCLAESRRWMARYSATGECECGATGSLYDVVGQRGDVAPEELCAVCARKWVASFVPNPVEELIRHVENEAFHHALRRLAEAERQAGTGVQDYPQPR
jgi:hypothetical protein